MRQAMPNPRLGKSKIACELRAKSTDTNVWIAEHFLIRHATKVCNLIRGKM